MTAPTPDKTHPEYDEYAPVWRKCRDVVGGQRKVHAGGENYLPKLDGQSKEAYNAYKLRAVFYNATGRTVDGYTGLIFRKAPVVDLPASVKDAWTSNINLAGMSLEGFVRGLTEDVITVGRAGILVDYPPSPNLASGAALTLHDMSRLEIRPYMTAYKAESILNWKMARIGNVTKLSRVALEEIYEDVDGTVKPQIRELTLYDGYYVQIIWRQTGKGWEMADMAQPLKGGTPLTDIPFYFLAPKEPDCSVQKPPIEDLADLNLSQYRNSADLENGAHMAGLPTPYVTGVDDPGNFTFNMGGSGMALPRDATAGFLQCGAEGFSSIEKLMDRKDAQMASLGARMLAPEKRQTETADALGIKRGGENSVLATLAGSVEMQVRKALQFMVDWAGLGGKAVYEMNKDYLPTPMSAQDLTAWVGAWQSGGVSDRTFFEGLKSGEVISEGLTFEEEQDRKADSAPALGTMTVDDDSE
ncbi:DUF4055 domain-containing protein [Micavibrio aeruginosavorus]|uniref:DUF4055 domain-containing protein n=1 Tax=Micavibrio aeruginosavorus (strain ARL-13) TaxID=856793 RepID=G2KMW7_MICAA|nr:DUF4055 domain-containing protein [Micavibrio aeruginosavorus]AEP08899.1 putative uncharacterized protein [Micavibrio aeruginosavorus ARL-13]